MSARFAMPDKADLLSVIRHAVVPLVAGGAVTGAEAVETGSVDETKVVGTIVLALVAGAVRLVTRWMSKPSAK